VPYSSALSRHPDYWMSSSPHSLPRRLAHLAFAAALVGTSGLLLALTLVGLCHYYTWLLVPGRLWQWLAWGLWAVAFQSALSDEQHA
jgi:hypothetical protein